MQHSTQVPVGKHNKRQHASPHHEVATDEKKMPIRPLYYYILQITESIDPLLAIDRSPRALLGHTHPITESMDPLLAMMGSPGVLQGHTHSVIEPVDPLLHMVRSLRVLQGHTNSIIVSIVPTINHDEPKIP